jgi:predicted enzyme related to lactoylglutathione lyase
MKTMLKLGLSVLVLAAVAAPALAQESGVSVRSIRVLANDAEASAKFYEKAFGMSETRRPMDTPTFKEIVINSGSTAAKAKAAKSTPIVIATKRNKDAPVPSMAALILDVPDMDKAIAAVVAAGGKGGKPNQSGEGLTYCMVADPDGNPIELLLAGAPKPAAKPAAKPADKPKP